MRPPVRCFIICCAGGLRQEETAGQIYIHYRVKVAGAIGQEVAEECYAGVGNGHIQRAELAYCCFDNIMDNADIGCIAGYGQAFARVMFQLLRRLVGQRFVFVVQYYRGSFGGEPGGNLEADALAGSGYNSGFMLKAQC